MSRRIRLAAVAWLALAVACADQEPPTAAGSSPGPDPGESHSVTPRAEAARAERLARRLALALRDPAFRAELKAELDRSPVAEQKLHFQRYVAGGQGRGAERIARGSGGKAEDVTAEALGAVPLELYFPVPEHRAAWAGGENVLVATALGDRDAPIAFDLGGTRHVLDPARPPATPVLALVPVETDFDRMPGAGESAAKCQSCGGDVGGEPLTGLIMTYASFRESFEGWLKGAPEFEIHVMGPNTASDTVTAKTFQCVGEQADLGYRWNMDDLTWYGAVRLMTTGQLDAFQATYPGRSFLVLALEDDDGPCVIRADRDLLGDLMAALDDAYNEYKGAKDGKVLTPGGLRRVLSAAQSGVAVISAIASLIKTNDEIIGFAIADSVTGRYHPTGNWTIQRKDLNSNGWLRLEIR